jgi:REP element-mobilizing transposase RayT
MTAPRQILQDATYLVTRRCSERRFFLRPSRAVNDIVRYVLAVASERYGVLIHAFCILSNHAHLVVTDVRGNLPAFEQYVGSLVARAVNSLHGHWEHFWAPGSYSAVKLLEPRDVLSKIAYVLANPVAAGLVRHGAEWPGLWSAPEDIGARPVVVKRPDDFFREHGDMPATATLQLVCPDGFESVEAFRRGLLASLTSLEDEAARKLSAEGRSFLGIRKVLGQKPGAWPTSGERRRQMNPRIAGVDRWKRMEAIARLKEFVKAYRRAWLEFTRGLRETIFPPGTYWMRIAYGVTCATG